MKAEITTTNAQAVVRATSTEMFQLWCLYADKSGWQYPIIRMENGELVRRDQRGVVAWKEQSRGEWRQIGDIAGRPICVAVAYAEINGVRVAFVEGISQLVDYKMIDEWVEREMPQTATHRANAMNWRNALHGIKVEPLPDVADLEPVTSEPPARVPPFALPDAVARQTEALLACGGELHAFRSGGGLRVVSIRSGDDSFYGEHPHVHEALRILADDSLAGGRDYAKVYGSIEPHYVTGASTPADELDLWILQGNTVDARVTGDGQIEVSLRGYQHATPSEDVLERCRAGETVTWEDSRGYVFVSSKCDGGVSTQVMINSVPPERNTDGKAPADAYMWRSVQHGVATTFVEAVALALTAAPIEAQEEK